MGKLTSELWKGAWSSVIAYTIGDYVSLSGSTYVCIVNNTNQTPPNATYWALVAQAGTNGIDGAVTLNTAQALTNKDLTDPSNTLPSKFVDKTSSQVLTNKDLTDATNTFPANLTNYTDGWIPVADTFVRVSNNSFKITGQNRTAIYTVGTRVKFTNNSVTVYGVVISSSFSTDTTVTLAPTSDFAINSGTPTITNPSYSYTENPQGYPGWFNITPTWAGFSANPTVTSARYNISGRTCILSVLVEGNGTSNQTFTNFTALPAPAAGYATAWAQVTDNGTQEGGNVFVNNGDTQIAGGVGTQNGGFTASGSKGMNFTFIYQI